LERYQQSTEKEHTTVKAKTISEFPKVTPQINALVKGVYAQKTAANVAETAPKIVFSKL
jgi:hypothetical protein